MDKEPVTLRALEEGDFDRIHRWHNDPALYETLGGAFRFVSRPAEREWLAKKLAFSRDEVNLAICLGGSGEHIGNIYLRDVDWIARHAELHVFLPDPAYRGKGYGSSATRQLVRHAFHDLGLQRVYLHVLADNEAAIKAYGRCGFEVEGTLRRHALKGGRPADVLVMGVLAEE